MDKSGTPESASDPEIEIRLPSMAPSEITALERLMSGGIDRFLEFGAGGSTLLAIRSGIRTVVSVESDAAWVTAVKAHPEIAPRVSDGSAAILHPNIGETSDWGTPKSRDSSQYWSNYVRAPWLEWERRGSLPELILVDGRFRVACCLSVILAWGLAPRQWSLPVVIVHDIIPDRRSYNAIFDFFRVVDEIETIRVLKIKEDISLFKVFDLFLEAQFDVT